jgi:Type I phosphodiesterase / nucleotide pyrophosphatase
VLVIAIDGTNMSKVLEEDANTPNFRKLMDTSTTSAPSIVGHTTISNPSWTAILTGAWDNKTGVINNVYTPSTYDRWPTVFTQLETQNPEIRTKAIADWDVIGAIAASGEGADEVVYIAQKPDDPTWEKTDQAVTDATVTTLATTTDAPNFMVAYLVQVDENGHIYGGDSPEYEAAIERTDQNLGEILAAVAEREEPCEGGATTGCGEDWTIIVVTDHGHQPQPGFGHGFQSPRETETFVIVDGPQFDANCNPGDECGRFNPDYEIVDVTPTVLSLFGVQPDPRSDGVPLQSLNESSSDRLTQDELQNTLEAQIASNDYPNIIVNVALSVRTIVAFLPYYVHGAGLPAPLGDILYVGTNVPAQVVAFFTGIHGARLFPILPPPPAITFIPDEATSIEAAFRTDCGVGSLAAAACIAS